MKSSRAADELLYVSRETNTVVAASYFLEGDSFRIDKRRVWATQPIMGRGTNRAYDLHQDGSRIVMIKPPDEPTGPPEVRIVLNFFDELRRLSVPT